MTTNQGYANTFKKVVDLPLINNTTIKELLCYNNINYWWPLSWGIFHELNRNPIHTYNIPTLDIKYSFMGKLFSIFELIYCLIDCLLPISVLISKIQLGLYKSYFNTVNDREILNNAYKIIILESENVWKLLSTDKHENMVYYNVYHGRIIDEIKKKKNVSIETFCHIHPIFCTPKKIKELIRKCPNIKITSNYYTLRMWNEKRKSSAYFKKVFKIIDNNPNWIHQWGIVSGRSDKIVKLVFKYCLHVVLPELVGFADMFNTLIKRENPNVFFQSGEQADKRRIATVIAEKNFVYTVALQHGIISATTLEYTYHDDTSAIMTDMHSAFPIPMTTCVWGEGEKELFQNNMHYQKASVVVTGNPRYDYLVHAHERYFRNEVCKKFGINPDFKIILWVTQCHGHSLDENNQYFREVFSTIKSLDNTVLIVKQHPGEGEMYTKLIQQHILEYQLSDKVFLPNKISDTTELVYISDVIINKHSTTGQEAVAFYKPMIILDFTDYPDGGMYVKEGVAVPCFEEGILKSTLMNIFEHGFHKEENQKIFIRKHMYKLDGCAAKRVADVILSKLGMND